jgi:hypothetical protein
MKRSALQHLVYSKTTPPQHTTSLTQKTLSWKNKFILASSLLPLQGAKT